MTFINNKYTNYYFNIINVAKSRNLLIESYTEKHHIIPKSLGGTNDIDNLVQLTAREHFICHLLLVKMCEGDDKRKMAYAMKRMMHSNNQFQNRHKISSRNYENLRIRLNNILKGRIISDEARHKMSIAKLGKPKPTLIAERLRTMRLGKTNTKIHRAKCSASLKGRIFTNDWKTSLSNNHANVSGKNNPNSKKWKIVSPDGVVTLLHGTMSDFCKQHNLPASVMRSIGRTGIHPKAGKCVGWQVILISS